MSPDEPTSSRDASLCGTNVAAFALGALAPAEAEAFCRHLETCVVCPVELRAFQQVVDDLAAGVPMVDAPPQLRRRVMRAVAAEPRPATVPEDGRAPRDLRRAGAILRRRPGVGVPKLALGSFIALAIAAIVVVFASPGGQGGRTIRASTTVGGSAALHITAHRTELVVRHVAPPPPGKIYEVWVQYDNRKARPSALFGVDRNGDASVPVAGSISGARHVTVTVEPAPRGTRVPTAAPVITAAL